MPRARSSTTMALRFGSRRLIHFFLLAFAFSWTIWGLLLVAALPDALFLPVLFLGSFGPAVAAFVLLAAKGERGELTSFLKRLVRVDRSLVRWLPAILLFFPALLVVGLALNYAFGGEAAEAGDYLSGMGSVSDTLFLLGIMLLGGPLGEEPGWRGYALEPLQERMGAVKASLLLGLAWAAWHSPLFLIEGTSQYTKGAGFATVSWVIQLMLASLVFTAVYNRTNESILSAILLHLMANIAYPLGLDTRGEVVFTALRILIIGVIVVWLSRRRP